jgi:hypothetical protein
MQASWLCDIDSSSRPLATPGPTGRWPPTQTACAAGPTAPCKHHMTRSIGRAMDGTLWHAQPAQVACWNSAGQAGMCQQAAGTRWNGQPNSPGGVYRGAHIQMHRHGHVSQRRRIVKVNHISAAAERWHTVCSHHLSSKARPVHGVRSMQCTARCDAVLCNSTAQRIAHAVRLPTHLTSSPQRSTIQSCRSKGSL